mmetsp:Transcript_2434/g.8185  ORF Transcript_2434/g.8185 Transcript_2434/m.8185 type:complete len:159 (+) Transcript_2434:3-479(+)
MMMKTKTEEASAKTPNPKKGKKKALEVSAAMRAMHRGLEALNEAALTAATLPTDDDFLDSTLCSKPWKAAIESVAAGARANVARVAEKAAGTTDMSDYESVASAVHALLEQATSCLALAGEGSLSPKKKSGEKRRRRQDDDDDAAPEKKKKKKKKEGV